MLLSIAAFAMPISVDVHIPGIETPLLLDTESGESIENVKQLITNKTSFPADRQILYYREILMENGRTLADYNIQKNSTLTLRTYAPSDFNRDGRVNFSDTLFILRSWGQWWENIRSWIHP